MVIIIIQFNVNVCFVFCIVVDDHGNESREEKKNENKLRFNGEASRRTFLETDHLMDI